MAIILEPGTPIKLALEPHKEYVLLINDDNEIVITQPKYNSLYKEYNKLVSFTTRGQKNDRA